MSQGLHPAFVARLRRLVRPSRVPQPDLVSIVVRSFDAEEHIAGLRPGGDARAKAVLRGAVRTELTGIGDMAGHVGVIGSS